MSVHDELRRELAALDQDDLGSLLGRSLLRTRDLTRKEIGTLLDLAQLFERLDREDISTPLFPGELHLALFFDRSTRTKSSWAGAAARLGARPLIVDSSGTQVAHGETARETGVMLGMNSHALGIRHDLVLGEGQTFLREARDGLEGFLAATGSKKRVPVLNLQCDLDHPTQTLADLAWLRQRFPEGLEGRKIAVSWAYSPSYAKPLSVPQGLLSLLTRLGMDVRLAHPPGYDLLEESLEEAHAQAEAAGGGFKLVETMEAAFDGADAVYPKSWGPLALMRERIRASAAGDEAEMSRIEARALEQNARHRDWICDEGRMARTRAGAALYMHCLPADIGAEVSEGVMATARLDLARQAQKKLYVIMAALAVAKAPDLTGRLGEMLS